MGYCSLKVIAYKVYDLLKFLKLSGGYSAGEHFVDIEGVTGSIPVSPTIFFNNLVIFYYVKLFETIYN